MADAHFWETMKILVGKDYPRSAAEDIQDWVEKVVPRRKTSLHDEDADKKPAWKRRMSDVDSEKSLITDEEVLKFRKSLNLPKIDCKFCHPLIRIRLEKLMGTPVCNLTDREFMVRYQERILEDYSHRMNKRIKARAEDELERIKGLILNGTLPFSDSPKEMAKHPVMMIDTYCSKLIAARRARIKIPKVKIPTFLYWDDTPDPESALNIGQGHVFRKPGEKLCLGADTFFHYTEEQEENYKLAEGEKDKISYEDPMVKMLLECDTVDEMYRLANKIIGVLKSVDENTAKMYEDVGSDKLYMIG